MLRSVTSFHIRNRSWWRTCLAIGLRVTLSSLTYDGVFRIVVYTFRHIGAMHYINIHSLTTCYILVSLCNQVFGTHYVVCLPFIIIILPASGLIVFCVLCILPPYHEGSLYASPRPPAWLLALTQSITLSSNACVGGYMPSPASGPRPPGLNIKHSP